MKRAPDRQLVKGDASDDNDGDSSDGLREGFERASADVMAKRRIVRVRRTAPSTVSAAGAPKIGSDHGSGNPARADPIPPNPFAAAFVQHQKSSVEPQHPTKILGKQGETFCAPSTDPSAPGSTASLSRLDSSVERNPAMKNDEPLGVVVASTPAIPGTEHSAPGSIGDGSSVLAETTFVTIGMAKADAMAPSSSGVDLTDPTVQPNIASPALNFSAKANGSSGNQNGGKIPNQEDGDIVGNVRSSSKEEEAARKPVDNADSENDGRSDEATAIAVVQPVRSSSKEEEEANEPVDNADGGNVGPSDEPTATAVVRPVARQTDAILGTVATRAAVVSTVAVAATASELSAPAASTIVASATASPLDTKIVQDRNRPSGSDLGSLPPTSAGVSVPGPATVTKPKSTPSFSFGGTRSGVTFGDAAAAAAGSTGFSFASNPGVPAPSAPISDGVELTSGVQPAHALGSARRIQANSPVKLAETKLVTGEEDEEELFRARCKLFVLEEGGLKWVERGVGHMKLNRRSKSDKRRLVMRTEATLRVILNTPVFEGFALDRATDRSVRFQGINLEDEKNYCTFLARFSAKSDLDNLAACLGENKE